MSNYVVRLIGIVFLLTFGIQTTAWCMGDPFDYSTGDVTSVSGGLWTTWVGSSLPANVVLYATGDTRLQLASGATRSSNYVTRTIPANDGLLYLRTKINVVTPPAAGTGDYFLCFKDSAGNARGRLFITRSTSTAYKLGVAFGQATSPTAQWATTFNAGTDYIVVLKMDTTTKIVTLWADLASNLDSMTETGTTHIASADTGSSITYSAVGLRQPGAEVYGGVGTIDVDDLLVGESWNEVVGEVYDVTKYGATPNSPSTDCQPGIQAAINAARTASDTYGHHSIVLFPTNTYYITGQNVQSFGGGYNIMYVNDILHNFVLDGSESAIQMQSVTNTNFYVLAQVIYLANCTGTTVKELNIDWTRPPFTVGTVTSTPTDLGPSGSYTHQWQFTVSVDSGYPVPADVSNAHRWDVAALTDMDATTGLPIGNLKVIDSASGTGASYVTDTLNTSGPTPVYTITVRTISTTSTQEGADRINHLNLVMPALAGRKVVLRHPVLANNNIYGPICLEVGGGGTIAVRDVNIHASTGMGMHSQSCNNITLTRVNLTPSNNRLLSTLVDGTFFTYCQGTITLNNCQYVATGDDSANVNAKYLEVTAISGNTLTMQAENATYSGALPVVGEQFEFFTRDTQAVYKNGSSNFIGTVQSATLSGYVETVTFDAVPSTLQLKDHAITQAYSPTLNVNNCTFNAGFARGLIVSTNNVTVTNSTFENIVYGGIECVSYPLGSGDQGPAVNNLTVDSCTFAGCGAADISTFAPSGTYTSGGNPARTSAIGLFQNFTITNNAFNPEGDSGINSERLLTTTRGLTGQDALYYYNTSSVLLAALGGTNLVGNNIFNNNNVSSNGYLPSVFLTHVNGLSLTYNQAPSAQGWVRTYYQGSGGGNDPVPNFGSTPTGSSPDYLIATDELQVSGGVPLTGDGALINYVVQIGDIQ